MKKASATIAAAAILVIAIATAVMAANPFIGTWKMNAAKSKASEPSRLMKSQTLKNIAQDKDIKTVFDGVDAQGNTAHSESSGTWDGKFYPVTGDPGSDMVSIKSVDANTVEVVARKAGKEVATYRSTVSKDGKTMTIAGKGKDEKGKAWHTTSVFEKE